LGNACDGWHLVREPDLGVIEERMPPGTAEVRHYHQRSRQFFYILSGEAVMEVDGSVVSLTAGQGLHIPPGVRIRFAMNPARTCDSWSCRSRTVMAIA